MEIRLKWTKNSEGDWQANFRGYCLLISELSPIIKVIHFRPMGGTIQWYTSHIDIAITDIDEHIEDNMHVNTCQD